jgi:hypothetical protein
MFHYRSLTFLLIAICISSIGIVSAAYFAFSGSFGTHHVPGIFLTNGSGNAGLVSFDRSAGLDGSTLTGDFSVETIGKVSFNSVAHIVAPTSGKVTDLWTVVGTASSLAGPISLNTAYYDPVGKRLVGYGMNSGIGKVPFGPTVITDPVTGVPTVDPTSSDQNNILTDTSTTGFQWRVRVIGTIGGNSAFDTFYSAGTRFNASAYNATLNQMRKNIALLTRNISFSNDRKIVNNTIFIRGDKKYSDIQLDFPSSSIDSLIIIGGDLIIDTDLKSTDTIHPKGIIVMKDESGKGGNVVVQENVKKIQASIFAEGTLYSGNTATDLYNDTTEKILNLSSNQLYIQGSLISRNTIGWATQDSALCVYGESSCTFSQAVRYDLNYFRVTPASRSPVAPDTTSTTRAYGDDTTNLDTYSIIIERDPRISTDPPPGWENK